MNNLHQRPENSIPGPAAVEEGEQLKDDENIGEREDVPDAGEPVTDEVTDPDDPRVFCLDARARH